MHSLAAISSWHESNEFLCHNLHIMMRLITPDVALPWRMRARARVRESLSKYSIKECARVAQKAQPSILLPANRKWRITAIALSRNTSIILAVTGGPFLSKVRCSEIVLSGRSAAPVGSSTGWEHSRPAFNKVVTRCDSWRLAALVRYS